MKNYLNISAFVILLGSACTDHDRVPADGDVMYTVNYTIDIAPGVDLSNYNYLIWGVSSGGLPNSDHHALHEEPIDFPIQVQAQSSLAPGTSHPRYNDVVSAVLRAWSTPPSDAHDGIDDENPADCQFLSEIVDSHVHLVIGERTIEECRAMAVEKNSDDDESEAE